MVERQRASALAILALIFAAASPARGDEAVDAAIVLAADVSRSIDDDEFDLQRRGYAAAIVSDKLMEAIHSGPHGAIALAYVEWAGEGEQTIVVDWTVLRNSTDAQKFAAALTASPRSFLGRTAIGSALDFAMGLFAEGGIAADRKVIDVSGDGTSNQGRAASPRRATPRSRPARSSTVCRSSTAAPRLPAAIWRCTPIRPAGWRNITATT